MGTRQNGTVLRQQPDTVVVSQAALKTWGRLLAGLGIQVRAHACRDGGLICEDRSNRARPRMWRVAPDGALRSDRSYSFPRRAFIQVMPPSQVAAR